MRDVNTPERGLHRGECDDCQMTATDREEFVLSPRREDSEDGVDEVGLRP